MGDPSQTVAAKQVPTPKGHYVQAMAGAGLLFISGQLPDPAIGADASFDAQVRSAVGQLLAILNEAEATPADLLKVNVYIVGVERWPEINGIYAELLGAAKPARAVIPVPALHYGWLIEVDAIATDRRGRRE
jgi:2-iminobutanoate/2-iminopropanoate deaminase